MIFRCSIGCSTRSTLKVIIFTILFLVLRCENDADMEPDDVLGEIDLLNLKRYEDVMNEQDLEDFEEALCIFIAEEAEEIVGKFKELGEAASALQEITLNKTATRFKRAASKSKLEAGLLFLRVAEGLFGGSDTECYGKVGCFTKGDNLTLPAGLPSTPESVGTIFNLYSRQHKNEAVVISQSSSQKTLKKYFGTRKDLVFKIHGFGQGGHSTMPIEMKDAFLEKIDCNFVVVLWTEGAKKPLYNIAAANTALVGRQIALLLRKLTEEFPETVLSSDVHLIGFSLGAHIAGFSGRTFTLITNKTIGRITGLDPANALFTNSGVQLRPSDADFVDVIHTNRGKASSGKMGINKPCGHVDFYPNGGSKQPGCSWLDIGCSHRRAAEYFVESLTDATCKFVSYSCTNGLQDSVGACKKNRSNKSEMGYNSKDTLGRGAQMLPTNRRPPYCKVW
ncbi:pancreatic lipase-related protein 2-like [Ixodes scapularis]|uniref:pancreatic lipase-related protein 2-like n=1 Tax=Ixodes scapularis TaxID=6945 RepID=UPI001A9F76B4|nr:pancreatic lipase-related protein 2-like [Ixodes scapularis]